VAADLPAGSAAERPEVVATDDAGGRLSRRAKLTYGVGDAGINLADTMVGLIFAIFLTDVVGLRPGLAALVIFLGRTIDYVNDPIIGFWSDRTRTRWGRRRPFLLFGAVPFAIAYCLLWFVPSIHDQTALALYFAFAFILYDTAASVMYMPYFALTPELTSDYDERTSLTAYRMAFSIFGAMIAYVVPLAIIGTVGPGSADAIFTVGAGVAVLSVIPLLVVFLGTRERGDYQKQEKTSLKESLLAAVSNKPFMFVAGIFLLSWAALDVVQATLLYYLKYRMDLADQSDVVFGLLFVCALATVPFWNWAGQHWDKRKAYIGGMTFLVVVVVAMGLLPPAWGLPAVLVVGALAGVGLGAIQVLTWSMIPDAIEWDQLKTGKRHEGMFYGLVTLLRKIGASVSLPLVLLVLDWTGYVANAKVQPHSATLGIQALIGPIPAVLLVVGIVFALFYPMDRRRHAEILEQLAEQRPAAGAEPG